MPQLTAPQRLLLLNLQKRAVVLSGAERDEERLAMLQLYGMGYVAQFRDNLNDDAMEWRISDTGRKFAKTLKVRF